MTKQYSAEYFKAQGALGGKAAHAQRTARERKEFMRTIRAARRPITEANINKLEDRHRACEARVEELKNRFAFASGEKKKSIARMLKNAEKRLNIVEITYAEKTKALFSWRLRTIN